MSPTLQVDSLLSEPPGKPQTTLWYVCCAQSLCRVQLCDPMYCSLPGSSVHRDSPGKNNGVGCHALLQGIFPTQGSNPGLPHCRQILYRLSYQGSPRILEWVAYPFSRGSSWPRNWTGVSCITGGFFTSWANRGALQTALQRENVMSETSQWGLLWWWNK